MGGESYAIYDPPFGVMPVIRLKTNAGMQSISAYLIQLFVT